MISVINKSKIYYIFNLDTNKYINKVFNLEEMISYLSDVQNTDSQLIESKYNNIILDNINVTLKDIKFEFMRYLDGEERRQLRKYVVIDGYSRIVDVRQYSDLIKREKAISDQSKLHKRYYFNDYYIWRIKRKVGNGYKGAVFRRESIPYISRRLHNPYRQVKVNSEKRKNSDIEIQKYVRSKRKTNNLPNTYYNDIYRHNDNCWKTQSKKKKQWMK